VNQLEPRLSDRQLTRLLVVFLVLLSTRFFFNDGELLLPYCRISFNFQKFIRNWDTTSPIAEKL